MYRAVPAYLPFSHAINTGNLAASGGVHQPLALFRRMENARVSLFGKKRHPLLFVLRLQLCLLNAQKIGLVHFHKLAQPIRSSRRAYSVDVPGNLASGRVSERSLDAATDWVRADCDTPDQTACHRMRAGVQGRVVAAFRSTPLAAVS